MIGKICMGIAIVLALLGAYILTNDNQHSTNNQPSSSVSNSQDSSAVNNLKLNP